MSFLKRSANLAISIVNKSPVILISVSCPSGRRCNSRKVVCAQAHRGFKSHRYRHKNRAPRYGALYFYLAVISGIWEEELVNRFDLPTPTVPTDTYGQAFCLAIKSVCGIWDEFASANEGSHRYSRAVPPILTGKFPPALKAT